MYKDIINERDKAYYQLINDLTGSVGLAFDIQQCITNVSRILLVLQTPLLSVYQLKIFAPEDINNRNANLDVWMIVYDNTILNISFDKETYHIILNYTLSKV